ncbi:cell division protein PerM [Solicola gregarius]|uniref:DUF6350 family protein n=1 Tax=Solicola gregarius TaxID=2908642 RepID=A0AA46YJS5_9ACTN|nr:DUF6350 family protein [Solicola gregarius]UYM03899.1 DUF6350 family protein [Solicola gregarius]
MTTVRERAEAAAALAPEVPRRPPVLSGVLAAGAVQLGGVVLCVGLAVVVWLASGAGSISAAMQIGAGFWLAGHGSAVSVGGIAITVVPLGVPLLAGVAVAYAAYRLGPESITQREVGTLMLSAAATYGLALAVTALVASSPSASFSAVRAGLGGFALAGLSAFVGAMCVDGRLREVWESAPGFVRGVVLGAGSACGALFGAAVVLLAYRLIVGFGEVHDSFSRLAPGTIGGAAIVLVCVLLLPNLLLLAVSVLLGPGFAFGTDTSVTVVDVRLGELPIFPVTAALPDSGTPPGWVAALMVVPLLAGLVGGVVAGRAFDDASIYDAMVRGATAGGAAGLLVGLVVMCAGGAVGPGRMADVGAAMWCMPVAVVALTVGGALGGALGHYREQRS